MLKLIKLNAYKKDILDVHFKSYNKSVSSSQLRWYMPKRKKFFNSHQQKYTKVSLGYSLQDITTD
jgi:hypothetical protein